ncbi:MAG: CCE_0567 family metalloprotein, partial [Nitrososphaeria archaeon]
MCVSKLINLQNKECIGTCKEDGADIETQKTICHSGQNYENMEVSKLKEEVKKLRMMAITVASKLHDLAEEGLPQRWQEIPIIAQEAYDIHKSYY